ncbi:MAG: MFS transporter [Myxococcota bacterium]
MTDSMRPRAKATLLGGLYFAQGLPYGFFALAVPVLLRAEGASLELVGASSLLLLPWAAKVLWAPLVDRYGDKRTWILTLQLLTVVGFAGLALLNPSRVTEALAIAMVGASFLAATQDVATDGLATVLLTPEERGWGNGLQVAAYRLGMILGGSALLILYSQGGWRVCFAVMSGLLLFATVPIFIWGHALPRRVPSETAPSWFSLWDAARIMGPWLGFLAVAKAGDAAASAMVRPYFVDAGWSLDGLAGALGFGGSVFGLLGAAIGGGIATVMSRRRALVTTTTLQAVTVGLLAIGLSIEAGPWVPMALVWLEDLGSGTATAAVFAAMMDRCRPGFESTDYTLQASWLVWMVGFATALSGVSAATFGYVGHLVLCTGLAMFAVVAARFVPAPREVPWN